VSITREENADYGRKYKLAKKRAVLALYGSKCNRCGFSDERALQIDHVWGDPELPRNAYGRGSTGLYIKILQGSVPKEDYQCLCSNCNWIKRAESIVEHNTRAKSRKLVVILKSTALAVDQKHHKYGAQHHIGGLA